MEVRFKSAKPKAALQPNSASDDLVIPEVDPLQRRTHLGCMFFFFSIIQYETLSTIRKCYETMGGLWR